MTAATQLKDTNTTKNTGRSFDEVMAATKAILPLINEKASQSVQDSKISPEVWQALLDAGLHTCQMGTMFGGDNLSSVDSFKILEELSRADGSVGWVMHATAPNNAWQTAFLSDAGVEKLLDQGGDRLAIAGMPAPRANTIKKVDGGYVINGKWGFATGSSYATHFVSGALLVDDNDEPVMDETTGMQVLMTVAVPRDQVKEDWNWDVHGMQATASIDYELNSVFVEEDLTITLIPFPTELKRKSGLTYQVGLEFVASGGETAVMLGIARRALEEVAFVAANKTRKLLSMELGGGSIANQALFKHELAMHFAHVEMASAGFYDLVAKAEAPFLADDQLGILQDRPLIDQGKIMCRKVYDVTLAAIRFAHDWGGSNALRTGTVLGRMYSDGSAANHHASIDRNHSIDASASVMDILLAGGEEFRK